MTKILTSLIGTAFALGAFIPATFAQEDGVRTIAIADFDYLDTSGEPGDRTQEHAARVQSFETIIGERLEASGGYTLVSLDCGAPECGTGTLTGEELLADARSAGADLLLFGAIHKVSTLIGQGWIDVAEIPSGENLLHRSISFRGDDEEAFARAAEFVAEDLLKSLPTAQAGSGGAGAPD